LDPKIKNHFIRREGIETEPVKPPEIQRTVQFQGETLKLGRVQGPAVFFQPKYSRQAQDVAQGVLIFFHVSLPFKIFFTTKAPRKKPNYATSVT
jgi:hypothetical protein